MHLAHQLDPVAITMSCMCMCICESRYSMFVCVCFVCFSYHKVKKSLINLYCGT